MRLPVFLRRKHLCVGQCGTEIHKPFQLCSECEEYVYIMNNIESGYLVGCHLGD
jgi:hypothetical protein